MWLIFACQVSLANAVSEGSIRTTFLEKAQTRLGKVEIKKTESAESKKSFVSLNGKSIYDAEEFVSLSIAKVFKIGEDDILLMTENMGGSGTVPSYFFITLTKGSKPIISESFLDPEGEPVQKQNQILIDLGFVDGKQATLIYEKGKTTVKKEDAKKDERLEDTCNTLYSDFYQKFIESKACDSELAEVGGMSTVRSYNTLISNPFIDSAKLEIFAKASCKKGNAVKYSEFKKEVCNK
jgi:hypothetical protein